MASQPIARFTPQEYLELERQAQFKSEYYAGAIFARAGVDEAHCLVNVNVVAELSTRLRGRACQTYPSGMKVATTPADLFLYPDASVVCGKPQFYDAHTDVLLNPILIVEVLSPSTKDYDRGNKFVQYRRLESLQHYVLISTTEPRVEICTRQADGSWNLSEVTDMSGACALPALGCELPLVELYERVEFPAPGEAV